jgi:hypothetical protein
MYDNSYSLRLKYMPYSPVTDKIKDRLQGQQQFVGEKKFLTPPGNSTIPQLYKIFNSLKEISHNPVQH